MKQHPDVSKIGSEDKSARCSNSGTFCQFSLNPLPFILLLLLLSCHPPLLFCPRLQVACGRKAGRWGGTFNSLRKHCTKGMRSRQVCCGCRMPRVSTPALRRARPAGPRSAAGGCRVPPPRGPDFAPSLGPPDAAPRQTAALHRHHLAPQLPPRISVFLTPGAALHQDALWVPTARANPKSTTHLPRPLGLLGLAPPTLPPFSGVP